MENLLNQAKITAVLQGNTYSPLSNSQENEGFLANVEFSTIRNLVIVLSVLIVGGYQYFKF